MYDIELKNKGKRAFETNGTAFFAGIETYFAGISTNTTVCYTKRECLALFYGSEKVNSVYFPFI